MNDANELHGRVRDVTEGGDAVVETDLGTVMVRGGLPGEGVRIRISSRKRGVLVGKLLEVTEISSDRRDPLCIHSRVCGGCPLMELSESGQRSLKRGHLQRVLGDLVVKWEPEGTPLGYRRRASLFFGKGGLGYRRAGSNRLAAIDHCVVLSTPLAAGLEALQELRLRGAGRIDLVEGSGGLPAALVTADSPQPEAVYRGLETLVTHGCFAGLALAVGEGSAAARFGDTRQQAVGWDGVALRCELDSFAQVHPEVNKRLVSLVHELAQPAGVRVLELHAGHGNLSVALAPQASQFVAVESDAAAARACRENLSLRGIAGKVVVDHAERAAAGAAVDVVVLDPPRTGAKRALEGIVARRPARIVYVSCATATLGRDLDLLRQLGYAPDRAHGLDMFPQTGRVEAVVRLVPRPRPS